MAVPQTQVARIEAPTAFPSVRITARREWLALDLPELWAYRELLYFFVWRDIKVRYKQTVIGAAWAVLQPLMTMLVFSLFFGKLAHIPSGGLPYPVFYYSALLPWMYFTSSLQNATGKIVGSSLEASNTDIADEFSKLIVTQQAYAANTKIITTTTQMVSDLLNVIR